MRRLFMASALLTVLGATPGMAEDYPWCAVEAGHGPSPVCSFTSLEQCRAAYQGAGGGDCSRNPFFKPSPSPVTQSSPPPAPVTATTERRKRKTAIQTNNQ
jgi:Protein of unknown function (DUF3551)